MLGLYRGRGGGGLLPRLQRHEEMMHPQRTGGGGGGAGESERESEGEIELRCHSDGSRSKVSFPTAAANKDVISDDHNVDSPPSLPGPVRLCCTLEHPSVWTGQHRPVRAASSNRTEHGGFCTRVLPAMATC